MSYQKVIIFGNVGRAPEVRDVNGVKVASFPLAVSEKYTDRNGESHENTEWFNVVCWRKQAELVEKFVNKGDRLFLDGKLRTRKYTTQNGEEKTATEVIPDVLQFSSKAVNQQSSPASGGDDMPPSDGDVPF